VRLTVSCVLQADKVHCSKSPSLNYFVGAADQWEEDGYAKRAGGLHIDDQLQLSSLLHRQIGRLLALENSASVDPERTISVHNSGSEIRGAAKPDCKPRCQSAAWLSSHQAIFKHDARLIS
jgi:hypothetical protein